ncbi:MULTISPECIES: DNA-formamidopyrimidine glycosylase family protein [Oerskovia]|uniref:DNA-(apurinic or apyrimidinic site) lyase n=1 Tax=Oerskovia gallyi TaxID=2762226 RepID=A0ABR8V2E5_9CELL|nr:DNA-formamidopyrimidine glycosylase family protein [Oerskovia gallyi]MBD7998954.1 Fpg/Nei family DNA glycosylase [Oerskovia gallyi]
MPEGDVVRVTAQRLDAALSGRVLDRAELRWAEAGGTDLTGRTVTEVLAYAKHLLTRLDDGTTLHTHLRMEGQWRIARTGSAAAAARGSDVRAVLGNEIWTCVGERLGMLDVVRTRDEHLLLGHLGPDILAEDFLTAPSTGVQLALDRLRAAAAEGGFPAQVTVGGGRPRVAAARPLPIADALLDQRGVSGLGTIYTAEGLFAQGMWPWTPVDDVSDHDLEALLRTTRGLMLRSVAEGVGTVRRHVHGRARRACHRCGTPVAVARANEAPFERPIFWCPTCQKP